MKTIPLKLVQIGKSRGITLPAWLIRKHGLEQGVVLDDRGHEIVLRPGSDSKKLSWEETYKEMAAAGEDWSDWDATLADGLDEIPWNGPTQVKVRKPARKAPAKQSRAKTRQGS